MRLTPFMLAALLPAASSAAQPPESAQWAGRSPRAPVTLGTGTCLRDLRRDARGAPRLMRRLDELPPGNLQLAVMREVDGCPEPVIVHYGIGAGTAERRR
ncbi:MAG TPA: hypothetical protein VGB79_11805 [Allosphingosinicella sp.]|jgi:hypothetical protein